MKNKLLKLQIVVVLGTLILAGCGGNKNQNPGSEEGEGDVRVWLSEDSTLYGLCGEGSAMNTLQLITDTGDTLNLSVTEAMEKNRVLGGYSVGDRMAVLTNQDRTTATLVINESELLGNWVMPDPIDGSEEIGVSIREGGIAESIDQTNIAYRTWRIINGQLEFVYVREGGAEEEEVHLYEILSLGNDSLIYRTVDKSYDEEETFEYSRLQIRQRVDKVQLEESSFDDFQF